MSNVSSSNVPLGTKPIIGQTAEYYPPGTTAVTSTTTQSTALVPKQSGVLAPTTAQQTTGYGSGYGSGVGSTTGTSNVGGTTSTTTRKKRFGATNATLGRNYTDTMGMKIIYIILAIFVPPIAVFLKT